MFVISGWFQSFELIENFKKNEKIEKTSLIFNYLEICSILVQNNTGNSCHYLLYNAYSFIMTDLLEIQGKVHQISLDLKIQIKKVCLKQRIWTDLDNIER